MNHLNFLFFEEYKRLDKLCGDIYGERFGVTHYIDHMKSVPIGDYRNIRNWKADLDQLKHLRHLRNHLAHTENAFDEDICEQEDIDWIKNFHHRILDRSDPIALLYQLSKKEQKENGQKKAQIAKEVPKYSSSALFVWAGIIVMVIVIMIAAGLIKLFL